MTDFLVAFTYSRKAAIIFVMSVRLFAYNSWASTWRVFAKFDTWGDLSENPWRGIAHVVAIGQKYLVVLYNWVRFVVAGDTKSPWGQVAREYKWKNRCFSMVAVVTGTHHVILIMRNVSDRRCRLTSLFWRKLKALLLSPRVWMWWPLISFIHH